MQSLMAKLEERLGRYGRMWAEAGKIAAAPFPAAKHTLIILSQSRNSKCTFWEAPTGSELKFQYQCLFLFFTSVPVFLSQRTVLV